MDLLTLLEVREMALKMCVGVTSNKGCPVDLTILFLSMLLGQCWLLSP